MRASTKLEQDCFKYLEVIRDTGIMNMCEAAYTICGLIKEELKTLPDHEVRVEARTIHRLWLLNYGKPNYPTLIKEDQK